jgi:GTP cyclohydrolase IB
VDNLTKKEVEKLKKSLPDIQKTKDNRGISINRVGVEGVDFQLNILSKDGKKIAVQATVEIFVSLKHGVKGINMSRLPIVLMQWKNEVLTDKGIEQLLKNIEEKMGPDVDDAYIKIRFKYFLPKMAPVSKEKSFMAYDCTFSGILRNGRFNFIMGVEVVTTSNCPCSKEISRYGAHGQRSLCKVTLEKLGDKIFWLEDLIPLIEAQGSCEIFPVLKRVDERWVTERAYKNSKFCEDVVRDVARALQATGKIKKFRVEVSNFESIHTHQASAMLARKLRNNKWISDSGAFKSN